MYIYLYCNFKTDCMICILCLLYLCIIIITNNMYTRVLCRYTYGFRTLGNLYGIPMHPYIKLFHSRFIIFPKQG